MKKILILIFILALCAALTSCDPGLYYFEMSELSENVVRIDLIDYDNPDQKGFISWVPDHSDDLLPFDESKCTRLEELDDGKGVDLLNDLSRSEILHHYYAYNSPNGISLRLTYENGDFLIVNCDSQNETYAGYIGKYSADGEVVEFYGCFSSYRYFEHLVNNYFDKKLTDKDAFVEEQLSY